jgi:hypothetical protein
MKKYKVHLKSTTYRAVEVEAEDEETAEDLAIASLAGDASASWLENAELETVETVEV